MIQRGDGIERTELIRRLQQTAAAELERQGCDAPFSVLDFPDHGNVGDAAIALGTTAYFREHRGAVPSYVASLGDFSEAALRASVPEGPIFIHGGGNFGDLWPRHQDFREHLLQRLPDREIVQLPQSIHFADRGRVARAARAIASHGKFRLLVRDLVSYEFAEANFDCEVRLCPDMALFLGPLERAGAPEVDVLYLMRTDKERAQAVATGLAGHTSRVADWLMESRLSVRAHRALGTVAGLPPRVASPWRGAARTVRCRRPRAAGPRLPAPVVRQGRHHRPAARAHPVPSARHPARCAGQQLRQARPVPRPLDRGGEGRPPRCHDR